MPELLGKLKAYLAGQAWDARLSSRLTTSPACIVGNEPEIDVNLAQRLRGSGLLRQAVLTLGARIEDPTAFVKRLNDLLTALTAEEPASAGADEAGEETVD